MTISQIVEMTGFAQPTVSMTVSALDDKGLVSRSRSGKGMPHPRTVSVSLSESGEARGEELKRIVRAMSMNTK
jgi:DNA-binding MarR family transcriptional regulator